MALILSPDPSDPILDRPAAATPMAARGPRRFVPGVAVVLLALTLFFNPALAIVNGHVRPLGGGIVAGVQAVLVLGAFACGLASRPLPIRWLLLAWVATLAFIALCVMRGEVVAKDLGDALLIPGFICLGTQLSERSLLRTAGWLQLAVVAVGAWELVSPGTFGAVFRILDYYVSTRGFSKEEFWAGGDLFVSSERGGGRMLLAWTGFHRGSSLFLEPVSLGNWSVVIAILLGAYWDRLSVRARMLFAASIVWTLFVCDGRLALGVCLFLAVWLPVARRLDARLAVLYVPLIFVLLLALDSVGALPASGDTLTGRFHGGVTLLVSLTPAQLMGVGGLGKAAVDAGWVYVVETQSAPMASFLWLMLMLSRSGQDPGARTMKHGVGLFIALCLPITYAILSIKTSALMWAMYGQFFQSNMVKKLPAATS
ncbi:polysaccharide biosynthesis protein GumE [uncultured Sphingomonas sp.]|uniref:polysaccharide biosynthesis protein GumE n=1 Tax=uncultured Sphingomonas sp. TaxID=158754 RepID=UPI0035CAD46A